jgi:hypothetical protein
MKPALILTALVLTTTGAAATAIALNDDDDTANPLQVMSAAGCTNPTPNNEPLTAEFYDRKWNCTVNGDTVTFTTFNTAHDLDRLLDALGPELLEQISYVEGPRRLWTASASNDEPLVGFRTLG